MPPVETMPMRGHQRAMARWRPYGSPISLSLQPPNESESAFRPHPYRQKPQRTRTIKQNVSRPLQFQDPNRPPVPRMSPPSPPPSHSMDYTTPSYSLLQSENSIASSSTSTTPLSLVEYVSTTRQLPDPTRDEDLPPLPQLPSDKPMLACADTPFAKELVARTVSTIQEIWCMSVDRGLPHGFALVGHTLTVISVPPPHPNPIHAPPPNPEVVAAAASVDAEHMLTPPGSVVALPDSDSPSDSVDSDDESEADTSSDSPAGANTVTQESNVSAPSGLGLTTQPTPTATHPYPPPPAPHYHHHHLANAVPPQYLQQHATAYGSTFIPSPPNTSGPHHSTAVPPAATTTGPSQVAIAQAMVPHGNAQHLMYFTHEVLRRSRASCVTLEIAMCYIGAIRDLVKCILGERAHLIKLARQQNTNPQNLDRRGVFGIPLYDPRRTFLAALVLATKFHQDRAYSNKAWAKLSGLPAREVTRCEKALGNALDWRLWVGRVPPTSAELLGLNVDTFIPAPIGVDGAGDVVTGIVSAGRCVSPPTFNVSADMLAEELYQEEVQTNGVHATFGGPDGIPGERDDLAAHFMEVARRSESTFVPIPRAQRDRGSVSRARVPQDFAPASTEMACSSMTHINSVPSGAVMVSGNLDASCSIGPIRHRQDRPIPACYSTQRIRRRRITCEEGEMIAPAAQWDAQPSTSRPILPVKERDPPLRRSSSSSSSQSLLANFLAVPVATSSQASCSQPSGPKITEEPIVASPEEMGMSIHEPYNDSERSVSRRSRMHLQPVPTPKTPRLTEAAIPMSSIVGAFRPQRSPPPNMIIPSHDGAVVWHPPPNYYRSLTPPAEFKLLPAAIQQVG